MVPPDTNRARTQWNQPEQGAGSQDAGSPHRKHSQAYQTVPGAHHECEFRISISFFLRFI